MADEKKVTLKDLSYPEVLDEIIKYMDYMQGTDEEKKEYIKTFVTKVCNA